MHTCTLIIFKDIFKSSRLLSNSHEKSNQNLEEIPEHDEGKPHKQSKGSSELRHEWSEWIDEDFLPENQRGLWEPHVQHGEVGGGGADGFPGHREGRVAAGRETVSQSGNIFQVFKS